MPIKFDRLTPSGIFRLVAEVVLLFLVAWAPWPFASAEYAYEAILISGTVLMVLLWIVASLFQGQIKLRPDAISATLLALIVFTGIQLIPLPPSIVGAISPSRLRWQESLIPVESELLPGEAVMPRDSWLTFSFEPFSTRVLMCQLLAMLLLYVVVRSWLATRESLRRVAWVAAVNGVLLSILGLAQFFSSPHNMVYWSVPTEGAVFGPFICKNHFPDYALFCLGLGVGLLVSQQPTKSVKVRGVEYRRSTLTIISDSPGLFLLGIGMILIVVSIPFSLSRGGLIGGIVGVVATLAAVYSVRGSLTRPVLIGGAFATFAVLLGSWFGWSAVAERFATFREGTAGAERGQVWGDVLPLTTDYLVTGAGGGAFPRIESPARTSLGRQSFIMNSAHNEYLEAILEGGLIRLALTLALCYFTLRTTLAAYRKLANRSSGPLILGIAFGLFALIAHSFVDFGIHMPAVAFLATVLVAYAADAATDPTYIPFKKNSSHPPPTTDPGVRVLTGVPMIAACVVMAALGVWLMLDATRRGQAEMLAKDAREARLTGGLDQFAIGIGALEKAVRLTPDDATAWTQLAQTYLQAALADQRGAAQALATYGPVSSIDDDRMIVPGREHTSLGLAAARTARRHSPLLTRPHLYLGQFAIGFAKSEPASVHINRALATCPTDPLIYIARGKDRVKTRDHTGATRDFAAALALDPNMLPDVLAAAQTSGFSMVELLNGVIPEEPVPLWRAGNQLAPYSRAAVNPERRRLLEKITSLHRGDWSGPGWQAIARAYAELQRPDDAFEAWKKAIEKDPNNYDIRDTYSQWLEADERDALAEEQLQWLIDRRGGTNYHDRLQAVQHSMKLKKTIHNGQ